MGRSALVAVGVVFAFAAVLPMGNAAAAANAPPTSNACTRVLGGTPVAGPTRTAAWKAGLESRIGVFDRVPGERFRPSTSVAPSDAPWLLVLGRPHDSERRCWLRVRLPWRPNNATGWVNARLVVIEKTSWRIQVSTARRTLTLFRAGRSVRTISVVVGKPSTPTPTGLFAIAWAVPWHPNDFLGSWVLELTAHSNVLQQFDGGDGTVGIHGRGGASLLDPLGSAASHGCIRLANGSIDWLVHTVGENQLPGTPVKVS
ncbi:MAG TPA: L,D-transpeptidase [Solirubrobacteraceae bacterium]|nr:L,D-transpeptidase [Solirubrobacteraceae bacterium]